MLDHLNIQDIDTYTADELISAVRQTLPVVLFHVRASQALLGKSQGLCKDCDSSEVCKEPCEKLNAHLANYGNGLSCRGNASEFIEDVCAPTSKAIDQSRIRTINKIRSDEIFTYYKNCLFEFTEREWLVVTLHIQDGMTFKAIGQALAISTSTASDTFQRAKKKMIEFYRRTHVNPRKKA